MSSRLILIVMLMGHVLGDFYFQSDKLVEEKKTDYHAVLRHGFYYSIGMAVVFGVSVPGSFGCLGFVIIISALHLIIDSVKFLFSAEREKKKPETDEKPWITKIRNNIFILDQIAHLISILACWYFWGRQFEVRWYIAKEIDFLPYLPIVIALGVLCLIKPSSFLLTNVAIQKFERKPGTVDAGKMIGYLERLIVFVFLMYNEFSAIAFVLTAKSLVRSSEFTKAELNQEGLTREELKQAKENAEYYLIGTLASVALTFAITISLGMCVKK